MKTHKTILVITETPDGYLWELSLETGYAIAAGETKTEIEAAAIGAARLITLVKPAGKQPLG